MPQGDRKRIAFLAGLAVLVAALFLVSLATGPGGFAPGESWSALLRGENGDLMAMVMREIRLPRAILGVLVGASLGLAGAAMQGFLRNPLAEPGLIGTSGAAALGAVLAIQTGLAAALPMGLPLAALVGALGSVLLILMLAGGRGGGSLHLILAGIAISALAGALVSLVLNLSPNPFAVSEIVFWMMGSLADRSMLHVWTMLPFFGIGAALILGAGSLAMLFFGWDALLTVAVEIAFSVATARAAVGVEREGWLSAAVRLTWKPLLGALVCAVLLGATIDHFLPHVHSLPEALRVIQGR